MDFNKILANKPLLYGIIGAIVLVLTLALTIGVVSSANSNSGSAKPVEEKVIKENLDLLTTDNLGKAIEIQALLAREGINAKRKIDGTKSTIYLDNYTQTQRDRALLAIVKSGLMDQNVGLEIFDKGDFTSTKEDKRIRLSRAINGELSRLIRKIPPIENASVFISIPEQSMFANMQKPITATVQITIPSGSKLDHIKVKAISNLLLGSVAGLTADNISITDTNGNVYTSIMNAEDEMLERIEENDKYMQQKVNAQLDRLIGKGNYVATVSTFLRQAPAEKYSITYKPNEKTAITEQVFTEGLGDRSQGSATGPAGPVSVYLPNNIQAGVTGGEGSSSQNRSYARTASERQYGVSKTQLNEYMKPGLVEEISVAVTLEKNSVPTDTTIEELKELIASAASPKVKPESVTIAFSDSTEPYLASDRPVNLPKPDETGNPWWITIVLVIGGLIGGFLFVHSKMKKAQEEQAREMEMLKNRTDNQDRQLQDVSLKASELIEKQTQLAQGLLEQQQKEYIPAPPPYAMTDAINELRSDLEAIDENEAGEKIKSWIEQR